MQSSISDRSVTCLKVLVHARIIGKSQIDAKTKHVTPLGFKFLSKFLVYKHFTPIGVARIEKYQLLGIAPGLR